MSTERPTNPSDATIEAIRVASFEHPQAGSASEWRSRIEAILAELVAAARTEGEAAGREEEAARYRKLVDAVRSTLDEAHPLQYGFERLPDGRQVATFDLTPRPALVAGEIYNRCPTCEQWSPCDVRAALSDLESP